MKQNGELISIPFKSIIVSSEQREYYNCTNSNFRHKEFFFSISLTESIPSLVSSVQSRMPPNIVLKVRGSIPRAGSPRIKLKTLIFYLKEICRIIVLIDCRFIGRLILHLEPRHILNKQIDRQIVIKVRLIKYIERRTNILMSNKWKNAISIVGHNMNYVCPKSFQTSTPSVGDNVN